MEILESTYCDYMMVISPPEEIKEMMRKYKLSSAKVIGAYDGMQSIAHITVTGQGRQMPVMMAQKLGYYQRKLIRVKANPIRITGFHYFTHGATSATIYAQLELSSEFNNWFRQVKKVFGDNQRSVPHMTIVKNIPIENFRKLWPYFADRSYNAYFLADRLTVLSRPTFGTERHKWALFKEMYLKK